MTIMNCHCGKPAREAADYFCSDTCEREYEKDILDQQFQDDQLPLDEHEYEQQMPTDEELEHYAS